jgi:uroporphyrinogen decarboxylase
VDTRYVFARRPAGFDGSVKINERNGRKWHDFTDEFGVVWSMPDDFPVYSDASVHPLADADLAALDRHPRPDGSDPSRFAGLREQVMQMRKDTPYAMCTAFGGIMYEYCWYMRGLEQWYIDLLEDPEFCGKLLDKMLRFWTDFYTGYMAEVGDLVDVIMIGDDLAGQRGPLFNPEIYRRLVRPRQKALVQHIKSKTKAKVWYHTCGACATYIPDLADNGVDILNPVQIGIEGMEPKALKDKYGRQMAFWGGAVDPQHVLPSETPAAIREHVRANMAAFKPGGGYVFANVHNIQAGVPPQNLVAMFDAGYEFGSYD